MSSRGIPTSSGYETLAYQNVGDMKNVGWEFNLNGNQIIKAGKFSADFNITFANNKNQITSMDETCLASLNKEFNRSNGSYLTRVELTPHSEASTDSATRASISTATTRPRRFTASVVPMPLWHATRRGMSSSTRTA